MNSLRLICVIPTFLYGFAGYAASEGWPLVTRIALGVTGCAAWASCWFGPRVLGKRVSVRVRARGERFGLAVPGDPWILWSVALTSCALLPIGLLMLDSWGPAQAIVWHLSVGATVMELSRVLDAMWTRWFVGALRTARGQRNTRALPGWLAHLRSIALALPMTIACIGVVMAFLRLLGFMP